MIDQAASNMEMDGVMAKDDPVDSQEGVGFAEILNVLAKRKKMILGAVLASASIATAVSMILPSVYSATVKLLPPQQAQSSASMLLSQLGGLAGVAASGGLKNPADTYVAMLKSRTVADRMIDRFSLQKHYELESKEKTRARLTDSTTVIAGKDGLITVEVEDRNQQLVAPMANGYVDELVKLTKTLAVTEAAQRRLFFEQELERAKNNLAKAEIAVKQAMDENGVISVDTEGRAQLETIARLRAQISAKEIALDSMKAFVTPNHPEYLRAQEMLSSLRTELSKLENGRNDQSNARGGDGSVGRAVGNNGIKNIQLLRDVKYYETLYEVLAKQYEAARLDEAKDSSVIQVLDTALTPERRIKPKRALIVAVAIFLTAVLSMILAFFLETKSRWLKFSVNASSRTDNAKAPAQ